MSSDLYALVDCYASHFAVAIFLFSSQTQYERPWLIFFFKQKTAYEIVSRDWSSDVCSSDPGLGECVDCKNSTNENDEPMTEDADTDSEEKD